MVIPPCRSRSDLDFQPGRRYARGFGGWRSPIGEMNPIPVALQGHTRVRRQSGLNAYRISGLPHSFEIENQTMTFQNMRLHEPIVNAIVAQGYEEPTPIQSEAIPAAMNGRDILGCAQTGTGKTCAFAVPILHRLAQDEDAAHGRRRPPRALVLCPTRELAMQIGESFENYGSKLNLRHTVVYGGVKQARQVRALREGVDVLIATPGRLLDLVNQGHIRLDQIETFVLDEAEVLLLAPRPHQRCARGLLLLAPHPHQPCARLILLLPKAHFF